MLGKVPVFLLSPTVPQNTLKCFKQKSQAQHTHMHKNPPAAPHMVPVAKKKRDEGERK